MRPAGNTRDTNREIRIKRLERDIRIEKEIDKGPTEKISNWYIICWYWICWYDPITQHHKTVLSVNRKSNRDAEGVCTLKFSEPELNHPWFKIRKAKPWCWSARFSTSETNNYLENRTIVQINSCFMLRIDESLSSGNLTVVQGETVMLVCTVLNLGDKSVSEIKAMFCIQLPTFV